MGLLDIVPSVARRASDSDWLLTQQPGGGQEMSTYQPTLRESLAAAIQDRLQQAGFSKPFSQDWGQHGATLAGFTPAEIPMAFSDLRKDPSYANSLAMAMALAPGAARGIKGFRGYHASPHDFTAFDMSKIGTGQGAQAYGEGMYLAGHEPVALDYRKAFTSRMREVELSGPDADKLSEKAKLLIKEGARNPLMIGGLPDNEFQRMTLNGMMSYRNMLASFGDYVTPHMKSIDDAITEARDALMMGRVKADLRPAHMYEVQVHAPEEEFLDWDKPLAGQPAYKKLQNYWDETLGDPDIIAERLGLNRKGATGADLHSALTGYHAVSGQKAAAETLTKAGIPGIRYLDQGSRGAGVTKPTHNYVVMDAKLMEIVRKYGLIGALMAGALTRQATKGQDNGPT